MRYPFVAALIIAVALAAIAAFVYWRFKKPAVSAAAGGKRAAHTTSARSSATFKSAMTTRLVACIAAFALAFAGIVSAALVAARPAKSADYDSLPSRKDIMLCLDVSGSLCGQNRAIVNVMKDAVKGLEGERIGITVFNVSSMVDVPLTDDYAYLEEKLDELDRYLKYQEMVVFDNYDIGSMLSMTDEDYEIISYYSAGISQGPEEKGSSLVGEGLATALYSLPYLEEQERTRIIVLSTDNEQLDGEMPAVIELPEAAEACMKTGVEVVALFPAGQNDAARRAIGLDPRDPADETELRRAVEATGGAVYNVDSANPARDIVAAIDKVERKGQSSSSGTVHVVYDKPQLFITVLIVIVAACACIRAVTRT